MLAKNEPYRPPVLPDNACGGVTRATAFHRCRGERSEKLLRTRDRREKLAAHTRSGAPRRLKAALFDASVLEMEFVLARGTLPFDELPQM